MVSQNNLISMIVAVDQNNLIADFNGGLPWGMEQKTDLRRFRQLTEGGTVIMGRRTFDVVGDKLPDRINIVVTRAPRMDDKDGVVYLDFAAAKRLALSYDEEVFIIGGAEIFELFMPITTKIYMSVIEAKFEGNKYFPELSKAEWQVEHKESFPADDKNKYPYTFMTYTLH